MSGVGDPAVAGPAVATAAAVADLFDALFAREYHTRLVGGAAEPLYLPSRDGAPARICYREDFLASALHEVAHWCIAGPARRRQRDYGYWYAPDGRDARQQRRFVAVEARPQALEWIFSRACAVPFRVSIDNLDAPPDAAADAALAVAVAAQARRLQARGLPERAGRFFAALRARFNPALDLEAEEFAPRRLQP